MENKITASSKAKTIAIMLGIVIIFFIFLEGISSITLSAYHVSNETKSEVTIHDPLLGWVGNPGINIPDEYGEGKYVHINNSGFRNSSETAKAVQKDKVRILCSGDSFTFGQGVANDETWCHLLAEKNDQINTVNLGQNGYGVDQMYLRYKRDGLPLEHSLHMFAFIAGDLNRMLFDSKNGYGKPTLSVNQNTNKIVSNNVPVPLFKWKLSRFINRANLSSVELGQRFLGRLINYDAESDQKITEVKKVARHVMRDVHKQSLKRDAITIFIYIPTENDLAMDLPWRLWAIENMRESNLNFIDLTPILRKVSAETVSTYFIPDTNPAGGHYSDIGNVWLAKEIYKNIQKFHEIEN